MLTHATGVQITIHELQYITTPPCWRYYTHVCLRVSYRTRKSENSYTTNVYFDCFDCHNSTRISLRRYTAAVVYLQHGGGKYCGENDVVVAPRTKKHEALQKFKLKKDAYGPFLWNTVYRQLYVTVCCNRSAAAAAANDEGDEDGMSTANILRGPSTLYQAAAYNANAFMTRETNYHAPPTKQATIVKRRNTKIVRFSNVFHWHVLSVSSPLFHDVI